MTNPKQLTIYNWLKDELACPIYAEVYKGAITLLEQKHPGYVSFVSHVGRDLMNGLVRNVDGNSNSQLVYQDHVSNIAKNWNTEWGYSTDFSRTNPPAMYQIPYPVCKKISELIIKHNEVSERNVEAPYLFFPKYFGVKDRGRIEANYISTWSKLKTFFQKHAHAREKPYSNTISTEIEQKFSQLEEYLYHAASSQKLRLEDLNAILDSTNA